MALPVLPHYTCTLRTRIHTHTHSHAHAHTHTHTHTHAHAHTLQSGGYSVELPQPEYVGLMAGEDDGGARAPKYTTTVTKVL